jgi:hypothetical protein
VGTVVLDASVVLHCLIRKRHRTRLRLRRHATSAMHGRRSCCPPRCWPTFWLAPHARAWPRWTRPADGRWPHSARRGRSMNGCRRRRAASRGEQDTAPVGCVGAGHGRRGGSRHGPHWRPAVAQPRPSTLDDRVAIRADNRCQGRDGGGGTAHVVAYLAGYYYIQ